MTLTRREFAATMPLVVASPLVLSACASDADDTYATIATAIRQPVDVTRASGAALHRALVGYATLAPSSHNTQCWKFAIEEQAIVLMPNLARRCPAVDPDNHHLFVSLGCATENLVVAASAHGLHAEAQVDVPTTSIRVALAAMPAQRTVLFDAIPSRQCTRGDYDGRAISTAELRLLERAGSSDRVQLLLLTDRPMMDRVMDYIVQGNTAQLDDKAFMRELRTWLRFNGAAAARARDGLYSATSGSPNLPTWMGSIGFDLLFTARSENDKIRRQIGNSAGVAVFVGAASDVSHWIEVGRCYERFALQATALGIRNAFLNKPVEVAAIRPRFADALGLTNRRPDLVVRFGRGPTMPMSLRLPLDAVIV